MMEVVAIMSTQFRNYLVVVKENSKDAQTCADTVCSLLKEHGAHVQAVVSERSPETLKAGASKSDVIIVLGGDGTILGTARVLLGQDKPIFGINFGKVGFLAETEPDDLENALAGLINGKYIIQRYIALEWEIKRRGEAIANGYAINDVVIARGRAARTIQLNLSINAIELSRLHCDGIIISAPLGATGYAVSAHGPLAFPSLDAVIVTPVSPFAGAFPPLVMPSGSRASVLACKSNGETVLTIDGQDVVDISAGDMIEVTGSQKKVAMLVSESDWYWRRLVQRGFVMPGPGRYHLDSARTV